MTIYYHVELDKGLEVPDSVNRENTLLLVIPDQELLPKSEEELVVLHAMHANNSMPMIWNRESATFTCLHCAIRVNFSKELYRQILNNLSLGTPTAFVRLEDEDEPEVIFAQSRTAPWDTFAPYVAAKVSNDSVPPG